MNSLAGHLLISDRSLTDPNFFQTVILMVQHDQDGALGLIINRPSNAHLKSLWPKIGEGKCHYEGLVYRGGPCEGPLMALHCERALSDSQVLENVFHTTSREAVAELVGQTDIPLKVFAGYSGWSAGQLEQELNEGSWLALPAKSEHVFGDTDELWKSVTGAVVGAALIKAAGLKHVPSDPRLN